ncbi:MAG: flagellar biosynthetic protein FliO [Terriglobia bacterium]|jgi:flagellar biogenesis protein FliO|nr:flagellar biosynthetic protein FliO [Terriglobia bacterium]
MKRESAVVTMEPKKKRRLRKNRKSAPPVKNWWTKLARWFSSRWRARTPRQLRLRETVPLGEKRFVALVEFEKRRFLIGGASNSVNLLTELQDQRFSAGLAEKMATPVETL